MTLTPFGIGTFATPDGQTFAGVVVDERVAPLDPVFGEGITVRGLLADWDANLSSMQDAAEHLGAGKGASLGVDDVRPLPPVWPPGQLFCAGANYRQHVAQLVAASQETNSGETPDTAYARTLNEMDERGRSGQPYVWVGSGNAVSGAEDDVILPSGSQKHDWELELAVVIGRRARNVAREDALGFVAGYTICNDITTRDRVPRPDIPGVGTDWLAGKNSPTFFPTGPYIVPAAFVDPARVRITLRLNGQVMQDASAGDMLFDISRLIEYVSSVGELLPGDMLLTGSPAGNGAHHGRYLQPGDVMEGAITGLGRQRNRCVAEREPAALTAEPVDVR